MSAVDAPPQDTLVSQPRREVTFFSRRDGLKLVYKQEYPVFGPEGRPTGMMTEGVRISFAPDGILRVPLEGTVTTEQGRKFPADKLLAWLQEHPRFGDSDEGFQILPQAAPPVSEQELDAILGLAMQYDAEGLRALLESERAGWNRQTLINSAEKALRQVEEFAAQVAAQQEAEASAPKPAAKKSARS